MFLFRKKGATRNIGNVYVQLSFRPAKMKSRMELFYPSFASRDSPKIFSTAMPSREVKQCQNCKAEFRIEPEDFLFYERIKVPPPTWCPECRMMRRMAFWNGIRLFRRKDDATGKEIFSYIHSQAQLKVYEHDYWRSDKWDPMSYGIKIEFSRPFLVQVRELMYAVPWPAKSVVNMVNAEYCNNAADLKNAYLCFECAEVEDSAYFTNGRKVKDSLDLFSCRQVELCYEGYLLDVGYRVFFSVNC